MSPEILISKYFTFPKNFMIFSTTLFTKFLVLFARCGYLLFHILCNMMFTVTNLHYNPYENVTKKSALFSYCHWLFFKIREKGKSLFSSYGAKKVHHWCYLPPSFPTVWEVNSKLRGMMGPYRTREWDFSHTT